MSKKSFKPFLGNLLRKIAPSIGAKVVLEPKWKVVGQIVFQNGRRRYFRYSSLDLNTLGSSEIAKDKDYANFFMKKLGYPTIPGKAFYSDDWAKTIGSDQNIDAAYDYALTLKLPVIVKPNSGSQGKGVAVVHNKREFYRAMKIIFKRDRVALVQRLVFGQDYRIVVLDNQVISAYQRLPLNVVGDGRSSIKQLLRQKQKQFALRQRDLRLKLDDPRLNSKLKSQKIDFRFIPKKGQRIFLLDNANLSSGGDARDVTDKIHPAFKKLVINLTKNMGLRLCGVDLMVEGDLSQKPKKYWVIEINAAPGLDHYVTTGRKQQKIVENLYLQVLKSMEK